MIEAIAPGPESSGIASGKTAMSSRPPTSRSSSAERERRSVRRSNTISSAISSSIPPPAIRNAASPMPSTPSTRSPASPKPSRIRPAIRVPLSAIRRRSAAAMPAVSASRTGTSPSGSMTTNRVVNACRATSGMALPHPFLRSAGDGPMLGQGLAEQQRAAATGARRGGIAGVWLTSFVNILG